MELSRTETDDIQVITVMADRIDSAVAIQFKDAVRTHSQDGPGHHGPVHLSMRGMRGGMYLRIVDHGAPMPSGQLPDGDMPAAHDLPDGGFGWPLVHMEADGLRYRRARGQNRVFLRLNVEST